MAAVWCGHELFGLGIFFLTKDFDLFGAYLLIKTEADREDQLRVCGAVWRCFTGGAAVF
jgi:hypothetical protein